MARRSKNPRAFNAGECQCTQNNIAFIPYGSLGAHPLKHGAPLANAEGILADIAEQKGVKPNQIALAWLLHYAPNIILIPGTTTISHLEENLAAASITLREIQEIKCPTVLQIFREKPEILGVSPERRHRRWDILLSVSALAQKR